MGPAISARISGIRIRVSLATPIVIAIVIGGVASTLDQSPGVETVIAAAGFCATLAVLLLHETIRIATYRRLGVPVRGLDLSITGGSITVIERRDSPRREVIIGISGLLVLIVLSVGGWFTERKASSVVAHDIAHLVLIVSVSLAIVQAMPALPLDGGRLFRAFVWFLTDDPVQGARAPAAYGTLISLGLLVGGILCLPASGSIPYWGFGAIVAGLQLMVACSTSFRESRWQSACSDVAIAEASLPLPGRVFAGTSIEEVVDALIREPEGAALLVVDDSNRAVGVIRLGNLRRVRRSEWAVREAADVLTPLDALPRLSPGTMVLDALTRLDETGEHLGYTHLDEQHTLLIQRDQLLHLLVSRNTETPANSAPRS